MVYLGCEVTSHMRSMRARASSAQRFLCGLCGRVHHTFTSHRAILVYTSGVTGPFYQPTQEVIYYNSLSSLEWEYRTWVVTGQLSCQSASALRLVSGLWGPGRSWRHAPGESRQHQKYLSDLVVRFSTSLALFTEKPRNIVRKLKAPFRPILPENWLSQ